MSPAEALEVLRRVGYLPGQATADHPARAEIKAALVTFRDHRIDPARALAGELGDLGERPSRCPVCGGELHDPTAG